MAYGFFSHKLLRWLAPLFLAFVLFANATLAPVAPVYAAVFALQAFMYFGALLGYLNNGRTRKHKVLLIPFYFVSMNAALLLGLGRALFLRDGGAWTRIERAARIETAASMLPASPRIQAGEYPN